MAATSYERKLGRTNEKLFTKFLPGTCRTLPVNSNSKSAAKISEDNISCSTSPLTHQWESLHQPSANQESASHGAEALGPEIEMRTRHSWIQARVRRKRKPHFRRRIFPRTFPRWRQLRALLDPPVPAPGILIRDVAGHGENVEVLLQRTPRR